jgi:flagellar hook-associated protein 1 FlgK
MDKLTQFSDVFANEINRIHMQGFDLNGEKGAMLFTKNGMSTADYESELWLAGLDGGPAMDVTAEVMNGVLSTMTEEEQTNMMLTNMDNLLSSNPDFSNKSIKYLSDGSFVVADRISAAELSLSKDVENDLDKLAASELQEGTPGDGNNALRMVNMRSNTYLFTWGSPDDFVKSLVANLGVDTAEAIRINENQAVLTEQVDYKRQSIMGVSLDEEMSNMVMYQHAYNASARMITTIDEMLDKIINGMGTVGR